MYSYVWGACVGAVYPSYDICGDEIDNDCDGIVDESCGCDEGDTRSCGTDVGECKKGIQKCENGKWSKKCYDSIEPVDEICLDGKDNNCDGTVDEDCPCDRSGNLTRLCPKQKGVCEDALQQCVDGTWQDCDYKDHNRTYYEKKEKSCSDEIDNDCDGIIDKLDPDCTETTDNECPGGLLDGEYDSQGKCCDNGILKYYCSKCGCPSGKICGDDGRCVDQQPISPTTGPSGGGGTSCKDSDSDGLCDDDERVLGTDPYKADTDGDGLIDKDDFYPLCDEDGSCEERETRENCPDCKGEKGFPWWLIFLLLLLLVVLFFAYWYIQKGKKKPKKTPEFKGMPQGIAKKIEGHSNVKQLYTYALQSMQKRIPESEIRKMSLDAGWTVKEIDNAIASARRELKRRYALSSRKKKSEVDIKKNLIKAGWNNNEIAWAFVRAKLLVKQGKRKEPKIKIIPVTTKVVEKQVIEKPRYVVIPGKKEVKKTTRKKTTKKKAKKTAKTTKKPIKGKTTKKVTKKTTSKKPLTKTVTKVTKTTITRKESK